MKITVYTVCRGPQTPGSRAVERVARLLADRHEVEVVSVLGSKDPDTTALLTSDGQGTQSKLNVDDDTIRANAALPARLIAAELGLSVLAESLLAVAARSSNADVTITEAGLAPAVRTHLPIGTPLIALGAYDADLTALMFADLVVAPDSNLVEAYSGSPVDVRVVLPWPETIPQDDLAPVIAAFGDATDSASLEHIVKAFLSTTDDLPGWALHVALASGRPTALRRAVDEAGIHGSVTVGHREHTVPSAFTTASAFIVSTRDTADGLAIALGAAESGRTVLLDARAIPDGFTLGETIVPYDEQNLPATLVHALSNIRLLPAGRPDGTGRTAADALADWNSILKGAAEPADPDQLVMAVAERTLAAAPTVRPIPTIEPRSATPDVEAELTAEHPELVRWAGTLNRESSALVEADVLQQTLVATSMMLTRADIGHIVISEPFTPGRIAVAPDAHNQVAAALAAPSDWDPLYAEVFDGIDSVRALGPARGLSLGPNDLGVRVFQPIVSPSRTVRYASPHGCTVEFWAPSDERPGFFEAPLRPSRRGPLLSTLTPDDTVEVGQILLPTTREALAPTIDDPTFAIDAVWTWVDDSDPEWSQARAQWSRGDGMSSDGDVPSRYTNTNELRYSLRSVAMYAPWIRTIYLVTAGQRPAWLDDHPRVKVIDHREIFDDPSALPTFNSHAIENQLHRIEGLSEHFLYFNDDVFLGRRVRPSQFFTSSGLSKAFTSPTTIPADPVGSGDDGYFAARKNSRDLLANEGLPLVVHGYLHTPHALQRSLLQTIETRFHEAWSRTTSSRFRDETDIAVASALHHDLGKTTGKVIDGKLRSKYVLTGTLDGERLMRSILSRRHLDVFCLNDAGQGDLPEPLRSRALHAFMAAYFPMRAPWERD